LPNRFANPQQRKFYLLMKVFKIGNIIGTIAVVIFIGKHFLGG